MEHYDEHVTRTPENRTSWEREIEPARAPEVHQEPEPEREKAPESRRRGRSRTEHMRFGAIFLIAAAAAVVAWLVLRDNGSSSNPGATQNAKAVSVDALTALAASVHHPIFWLGPKKGYTYELTRTSSGSIYVRYLPPGEKVGTKTTYLTVATYPFPAAYTAIRAVIKQKGTTAIRIPAGGLAEVSSKDPTSVHLAYPGVDYQVEVYDPTVGEATALVAAGKVIFVGDLRSGSGTAPQAAAASPAKLRAVARSLGHPVYWIGPKAGYTYELRQTSTGLVYIRYLPSGTSAGATGQYLTVGTYPYAGAFAATEALAKQSNSIKVSVPRGGVGAISKTSPKSIHVAYPGENVQVEVFDPSPATARRIVTSGQVRPVG